MNPFKSLRGRVVLGAAFWTLGLFTLLSVIFVQVMTSQPHTVVVIHRTLGHFSLLTLAAIGLLLIGLAQIRQGVSSISALRSKIAAIHQGKAARLEGEFPAEVRPLVDDLNAMLAHSEATITRAQAKAGDLAHGLKTPLAVLAEEANALDAAGHAAPAAEVRQQIERMRRQIDWHLAHARAAASAATPTARCPVEDSVEAVVRVVRRIYADRRLTISTTIPPLVAARAQRADLDEMVGNLLDNACKWAAHRIEIVADIVGGQIVLTVDDDGPGVPADQRQAVLRRGVRADESAPGSGFGLAIVRDLAEVYGGTIHLDRSALGGARAVLSLPLAER